MRKFITAALLAATALVPTAASAQSRAELRDGRREIREERREIRDAIRRGDYRDYRDARDDLREARRDYREDLRDFRRDDWRAYRNVNRGLYRGGGWQAPFRYHGFRPGVGIAPAFYSQRYWVADPYRYRLPRAFGHQRWVRHYDDVLLVDVRRGVVLDAIRGFYW